MVIDFTAQSAPALGMVLAVLALSGLAILACIDPDLTEIFFSDTQILIATVTLAALAVAVISGHADLGRQLAGWVPGG